ncbi:MAG TPA: HTTM domain-containing protein [Kofleriaceae bacterium]|nr:HTTM domain-containing protein [Kofleriaceae bacterium]
MTLDRMRAAATRPIDIASLAAFRIIFGAVMFAGIVRFVASGQLPRIYGEPKFFFTYPGFDWVTPWPVTWMYVHYCVLAVLALAIAAGAWHRIACALFAVGFAYTQLIDITNYLNHHYLVVLIAVQLALLPAHRTWSIDAWRKPALQAATIPAWIVWLLRFQTGVVYVFAGLAKAKSDWLLHGQPLNTWLAARTETPLIGRFFDEPSVALAMSWAGFLFDTTIVFWLSWARTRIPAYVALIAFHGLTGYLFMIGMFPLIMTSAALIFFPPDWPRTLLHRIRLARFAVPRGGAVAPLSPRVSRVVAAAIAIHVIVQVALPLRHVVYPGAVLWNEDGMRFAWHVMIREKHGAVTFVAELDGGKQLEIPPSTYLTWRQEREMAGQPDLILQLAHRIGSDLVAQGHRDVRVRAVTSVSLNGRAPAPLIDPAVDLLGVRDIGERKWVLAAPDTDPPVVQPLRQR